MRKEEIGKLDTDTRRSIMTSNPGRFAKEVADRMYHDLFEITRLVAFVRVSPPSRAGEQGCGRRFTESTGRSPRS